ncbi:hypothetical protein HK405_004458 [Cladochytrium tenue]|nr:hypothetical protein HK405_004458 [Cladochytrium tenue]
MPPLVSSVSPSPVPTTSASAVADADTAAAGVDGGADAAAVEQSSAPKEFNSDGLCDRPGDDFQHDTGSIANICLQPLEDGRRRRASSVSAAACLPDAAANDDNIDAATAAAGAATTLTPPLPRVQRVAVVAVVAAMAALNNYHSGMLTVALPAIAADLAIPPSLQLWPAAVYSLAVGCSLLLFAALADALGRRPAFLAGAALAAASTLAAARAADAAGLIAAKAVQGLAMATCMPTFVAFISETCPQGPPRNRALAALDAGAVLGFALGLLLAGLLTSLAGWRAAMYLGAATAAALLVAGYFCLPRSEPVSRAPVLRLGRGLDWVGIAIACCCLAMLSFVLTELAYSTATLALPQNIVLLILSVALVPAFIFWIRRQESRGLPAIIPSAVWRKPEFASACVAVFLSWATANAFAYLCSLYFQNVQRLSPFDASLRFLPNVVSGLVVNAFVGRLVERIHASALMLGAGVLSASAPVLLAVQDPAWSFWAAGFPALLLQTVSTDLLFSVSTLIIVGAFAPDAQALAGGIFNAVAQLGTFVGLAVAAVVTTAATPPSAGDDDDSAAAAMAGYRAAFWLCFAATIVSTVVGVVGFRRAGRVGLKHD